MIIFCCLEAARTGWPRAPRPILTPSHLTRLAARCCWRAHAQLIVVARNPKDAAVSMWHHSRDVPVFQHVPAPPPWYGIALHLKHSTAAV